jgi:hypothetical protein
MNGIEMPGGFDLGVESATTGRIEAISIKLQLKAWAHSPNQGQEGALEELKWRSG